MLSSSTAQRHDKIRDAAADAPRRLRTSAVSLVPGPKPLTKYRFYLDVKNHITSGKLETKIKDLGGVLELFLVKEVTHVVTDREECLSGARGVGSNPRTPRTPQKPQDASLGDCHQQQHGSSSSSTPARGRPKTRADAMLERARSNTPTQPYAAQLRDTFKQAKAWGIPVWSIDRALVWLEKVASGVTAEKQKPRRKCKLIELKAPYVKFEAFDRRHRPVFKEIRNWPSFDLTASAGSAAVSHKPAGEQRIMTKSRAPPQRNKVRSAPVQSGYCELCREEYSNLVEHLESKKHLAFIKDNDNFLELDSLIQNGTDLNSFLKITAATKCDGTVDSPSNCNRLSHKMPRTRTSSITDCIVNKVKNAPVSPTGSESGHRLRTRKSNMTYIGLTAQEQEEQVKPEGAREVRETRELRSANKVSPVKIESDTWGSGRPKRNCLRQKRNSFLDETGLQVENRGYYRVEMTPKLRSSAVGATFKDYKEVDIKESPITEEIESEQFMDDKSLLVKFRRLRTSELQRLNNEAENFLFPRKDETSSEEDIDADGRDTTVETAPGDSIVISSETDTEVKNEDSLHNDSHDVECCDKAGITECRRKKRSQAEAFIEDNKKYYKFETPGSRLRYHGTTLTSGTVTSPKKNRLNGDLCNAANNEIELTTDKPDKFDCDNEVSKKNDLKFTLDELKFSFETIPKSEPWYETFSRQDQGGEFYTCFSDSGYWKPFLLPYQMDRIQPLDPKVCIQTYSQIKKLLQTEGSSGTNSTQSCTPDCSAQGSPAPDIDENSKASEDSALSHKSDQPKQLLQGRRRRKKGILLPSKNPRKSPRQHASTLAILSSLIQHRKKRKSESPNNTLDSIPEASESQDESTKEEKPEDEINKVVESIDDMLTNAFGEMEQVEMSFREDMDMLDFSCKSDAIEILEDYENYKHVERKTGLIGQVRRSYSPGKKPGRKKKKNRTGWPKNNIRKTNLNTVINKTLDLERDEGSADVSSQDNDCNDLTVCVNVSVNSNSISDGANDRVDQLEMDMSGVSSVDLDKWENAEKVLSAKITNDANKEPMAEDATVETKDGKRRLRSSSSPPRAHNKGAKRARRMPASPKSPRVLRKPRGRWYRER